MLLLYHYLKRNNKDTYITYTFLSFFVFFQRISLFVFFLWQDNREGEGNKKWQASYWPTSGQHCSMVRPGHTVPVWPVSGLSMQGWLPHCQLVTSCHIARSVTGMIAKLSDGRVANYSHILPFCQIGNRMMAILSLLVCRDVATLLVGHKTRTGGGPMRITGPKNWSIISHHIHHLS